MWIGLDPQTVDETERGPVLRFAHFRYFREGELMLKAIAPNLEKAMRRRRFRLYGFSQAQEREIGQICRLAKTAAPSALTSQESDAQVDERRCHRKFCRRTSARRYV